MRRARDLTDLSTSRLDDLLKSFKGRRNVSCNVELLAGEDARRALGAKPTGASEDLGERDAVFFLAIAVLQRVRRVIYEDGSIFSGKEGRLGWGGSSLMPPTDEGLGLDAGDNPALRNDLGCVV